MLDHYIQKNILYRLAFADELKFSELKPGELDNKLFTYHLKIVVREGFVEKLPNGSYQLTPKGRRVGKGALQNDSRLIDRAYSILLLAVKRPQDGAWLLFKRKSQPLLGLSGFMQAQPLPDITSEELAAKALLEKAGLQGSFKQISSGFFKIYKKDELESFTNFTLLFCENPVGELEQKNELGEYYWDDSPDFSAANMLPTAQTIANLVESHSTFCEQIFTIS